MFYGYVTVINDTRISRTVGYPTIGNLRRLHQKIPFLTPKKQEHLS